MSSRERPSVRSAGWFGFLAPSVADLFFIAILFSLSCGPFGTRPLGDGGTGWHIRNGEHILQTHRITRVDIFSSSLPGHSWYAWEWLYDVIIASIHHWLGLNGVVLFTAAIIGATFSCALRVALKRGAGLPVSMALLVLSMGVASIHLLARPHVLSWLFAVIWFQWLDSDATAPNPRAFDKLTRYPMLMMAWANLHGGFLIGFVLIALYFAGGMIELFSPRTLEDRSLVRAKLNRLAAIASISLAASLLNPFGYKLYSHIYGYLTNRFLMDHIDEFLSPNFHGWAQKCFAAMLLITLLALAFKVEKLKPAEVLVIVFAAYSGLYSSRNLPVSAILLTLIIAPILSKTIAHSSHNQTLKLTIRRLLDGLSSFSDRMDSMEFGFHGHLPAAFGLIFAVAICMHNGKLGGRQWMNSTFSPSRFPVQATNIIASRHIRDPIFCPDYWGGYLIYRLYPQTKVVIDDRHDFYGQEFLLQYLQVIHVTPRWSEMLDQQDVRWVLTPTESPLANILKLSPIWTVSYADDTALLFQRK
jgi:hypothetical protein